MSTANTKTASSALRTLRDTPQKQAKVYQDFRGKAKKVRENPYLTAQQRNQALQESGDGARASLEALQSDVEAAHATIKQRANASKTAPTAEGRQKVRHALQNGWNLHDLMDQFVKEQDRQAIASTQELLPYLAREGLLSPADPRNTSYEKQINDAASLIRNKEAALDDETQQQARAEEREAGINKPFLDANTTKLKTHIDSASSPAGATGLDNLFHWQGLPEQPTGNGTYLNLENLS